MFEDDDFNLTEDEKVIAKLRGIEEQKYRLMKLVSRILEHGALREEIEVDSFKVEQTTISKTVGGLPITPKGHILDISLKLFMRYK